MASRAPAAAGATTMETASLVITMPLARPRCFLGTSMEIAAIQASTWKVLAITPSPLNR